MAVIQSEGRLAAVQGPTVGPALSLSLYDGSSQDYGSIYRTQPAVRTVVSFLARNIADLGVKVYRRVSDTDRVHIPEHPLSQRLSQPNAYTTRYRFINELVSDLAIYDVAYWAKVKDADDRLVLQRLPVPKVTIEGENWVRPDKFVLHGSKGTLDLPLNQVVYFRGYNPDDPRRGASPMESLRQILAEELEAARYREQFWRSHARVSGFLTRPLAAPEWSAAAKARFKAGWQSAYTGAGPEAGGTPILEEGMEFVEAGQSARDSQYIEARKLTREEVAAAYHIPPPMVGILEHATFSNITEQHKNLYQDTLGPWLSMIEQEIALQLLPEYGDPAETAGIYVEFNLLEKLKGSFEEQASSLQTSVGRPIMTANEGRARVNLPRLDTPDADSLVVPLNVLIGGQASPTDSAPPPKTQGMVRFKARPPLRLVDKHAEVLAKFFRRQERVVASQLGAKKAKAAVDDVWDDDRWNGELSDDLFALNDATARAAAEQLAGDLGVDFDPARLAAWLRANADGVASGINGTTKAQIEAALADDDPQSALARVFEVAVSARAGQIAMTQVTNVSGFATHDVASTGGLTTKTWIVLSNRPRSSHAAMDGETVGLDDTFSNGARWPGDGSLPDDERAGCTCDLGYGTETV